MKTGIVYALGAVGFCGFLLAAGSFLLAAVISFGTAIAGRKPDVDPQRDTLGNPCNLLLMPWLLTPKGLAARRRGFLFMAASMLCSLTGLLIGIVTGAVQ